MQRNQMNHDNDRIGSNGAYNEYEQSSRQDPRNRYEQSHQSEWSGQSGHYRGDDWNGGGGYGQRDLADYRGSDRSFSNNGGAQRPGWSHHDQGRGYQDRGYQDRGYQNQGYQDRGYQDRGYQDRGYQGRNDNQDRGYQDRGYQGRNDGYQDRGYQDRGYQGRNDSQHRGYQERNNGHDSRERSRFAHDEERGFGGAMTSRGMGTYTGSDDRYFDRERSSYGGSHYDRGGFDRDHRGQDDYDRRWTGGGYEEDRRGR